MHILSSDQLFAVTFDTATYADLEFFLHQSGNSLLQRIDPETFLSQSTHPRGLYINLVIKDVELRKKVSGHFDHANLARFSFIHKHACVVESNIAPGCMIYPNTTVYPFTSVDNDVIIHSNSVIAHCCKIHTGVFISMGVIVAGSSTVGKFTQLNAGVTVYDHIQIAGDTVVGARGVVRKSITEPAVYIANNTLEKK